MPRVAPLLGTSLILDINVIINWQLSKQGTVRTDQYHMITLRAQVKSSLRFRAFWKLTADHVLGFQ